MLVGEFLRLNQIDSSHRGKTVPEPV
jgi:hypothetical protein